MCNPMNKQKDAITKDVTSLFVFTAIGAKILTTVNDSGRFSYC